MDVLPPDLPPDPRDVFTEIHVVTLPMVTRFRGITHRELMLVRGPAGWAEFSPFVEYPTPEAARWLAATIEIAVHGLPQPTTPTIPVNATIPDCPPEQVPALLARFGPTEVVKIKIASEALASLTTDVARVKAVVTTTSAKVRLDANGAYTHTQAITAIRTFAQVSGLPERLEYVEQPTATVEDLARVREAVAADGVRIAADESIRKAADPLRVARLGAADHIIVKVQPLGGVRAAVRVVEECGLPATVSSALESSVGLCAGAALAARLPGGFAAGLATGAFFAEDVVTQPLLPTGGMLPVGPLAPDAVLVRKLTAAPARQQWWMRRLDECWAYLRGCG